SPTWLMILAGYKLPSQKSSINNCSARYFAIFCQALFRRAVINEFNLPLSNTKFFSDLHYEDPEIGGHHTD
ncbi:MAG: hypothetical protein H7839_19140, partial [Magnetococcus sp. YQC-5]